MNKQIFIYFFVLGTLILSCCTSKPTSFANYSVVPLPQEILQSNEELPFILTGKTKIVYPKNSPVQRQTAIFLSEYIKTITGLELKITDESLTRNVIILRADHPSEKNEQYNLSVNEKRILINGTNEAGTFYGAQTLRKSIPIEAKTRSIAFPAVEINDYPRFQYRGMMLDVSRHFFSVDFIKKYIDILALHNINRFHWHLTDDQGWRIEIKNYPKLTSIGSVRAQTVIGKNSGEFDGKTLEGYYTQDQIREIVEYAEKRFITIIPEIDLPGHMMAALTAYPELGCTGGPYHVQQQWGIFDDVLCAGDENTYIFLENVLSEVINLFPSEYIHIGGDECPKTEWMKCKRCQAKIKELGLKAEGKHTKEDVLQSYMVSRIDEFLSTKGRQIIGWDEILDGKIVPSATIMSWRGIESGIEAAITRHNVIMTPSNYLYFDYYQTKNVTDEPLAIGGFIPIEKVYNFEPIPKELSKSEEKFIIGTQANLWTEYIADSKQVEYMIMPRIGALSEIQWTMQNKKDYKLFLPRLAKLMALYKINGYNYANHIRNIEDEVILDTDKGNILLTLFTFDNAPIYYTLDGSKPSKKSMLYKSPLIINSTCKVRAISLISNVFSDKHANSYNFNKATLKKIELLSEPHKSYAYDGALTLIDGKRGEPSFTNGQWIGIHNKDFVASIDLT